MTRRFAIGAIGLLAAGLAACRSDAPDSADAGGADDVRSVTTFRQWHGESRLNTQIMLFGGSLRIIPGPRNELYRLTSAYNHDQSVPDGMYNVNKGLLEIGRRAEDVDASSDTANIVDHLNVEFGDGKDGDKATTSTLALSPAVTTAFGIVLVGMNGDMELGGLQTSSLDIATVAGETTVRFSQPNAAVCTSLGVDVGLSNFSLIGLGNSRCQRLNISGSAAHVTLDFTGSWPASVTMQAKIVAGSLEVRVPRNIGVRVTRQAKVLARLSMPDMARDGDALVSSNYASAERRLDIETTAMMGEVSLKRID